MMGHNIPLHADQPPDDSQRELTLNTVQQIVFVILLLGFNMLLFYLFSEHFTTPKKIKSQEIVLSEEQKLLADDNVVLSVYRMS
ncbi:hypothetical protein AN642_00200 [Epulopiscium sp. SCG-B10WGA-EpuloA2]|nr:hypothetical protein AN642_00200 [Epulopiscium sp. SCG-B10WGA-EpuloA2]